MRAIRRMTPPASLRAAGAAAQGRGQPPSIPAPAALGPAMGTRVRRELAAVSLVDDRGQTAADIAAATPGDLPHGVRDRFAVAFLPENEGAGMAAMRMRGGRDEVRELPGSLAAGAGVVAGSETATGTWPCAVGAADRPTPSIADVRVAPDAMAAECPA